MTSKLCLRCDWDGDTVLGSCPACGAQPLYVPARPQPRPVAGSDGAASGDVAPGIGTEPPPAPPPDTPHGQSDGRSLRIAVAVALVAVLVAMGTWLASDRAATIAAGPMPQASEAAAAATRFLQAYGELDADRAIEALADDADLTLLIRSIGADGVEGTEREFRSYLELLEAWRYRQTLGTCDAVESAEPDTLVRCGFDYDFLGSDDLGFGPYTGSSFDVTVRDGEVVAVSKFWAFDRFSREMWEPFGEWIATTRPGAATRMYEDPSRRGVRLDRGSIRRWARYTDAYIRLKVTGRVVPHDDG